MGYNKRRLEDERRREAKKQAAERRALNPQVRVKYPPYLAAGFRLGCPYLNRRWAANDALCKLRLLVVAEDSQVTAGTAADAERAAALKLLVVDILRPLPALRADGLCCAGHSVGR
jgi:hypothetical protein